MPKRGIQAIFCHRHGYIQKYSKRHDVTCRGGSYSPLPRMENSQTCAQSVMPDDEEDVSKRQDGYEDAVRLEMDSDSARHILQRRGPSGLKHIEIRCLSLQRWIRDKRLSVSRVDTKNNTADVFTKHLDGLRTRALAKTLGLRLLDMADGGTNGNDR